MTARVISLDHRRQLRRGGEILAVCARQDVALRARCFDVGPRGGGRFVASRLVLALRAEALEDLRRDVGEYLSADDERWARRRIAQILGDEHSRARAGAVVAYLHALA